MQLRKWRRSRLESELVTFLGMELEDALAWCIRDILYVKSTILLLDDERDNLTILENLIKGLDYAVDMVSFTSSRAALAWCWCCRRVPDLCLIDYMMPDLDGLDFLTAARKLSGFDRIPIIMITGMPDSAIRQHALSQGATEFWAKPIDADTVRARLCEFLDEAQRPVHEGGFSSAGLGQHA